MRLIKTASIVVYDKFLRIEETTKCSQYSITLAILPQGGAASGSKMVCKNYLMAAESQDPASLASSAKQPSGVSFEGGGGLLPWILLQQ